MARTLNPVAHALKRDSFVDAAQRLIVSKGYEPLSIQDVLDELGASKGAFYHYFDTKEALLAAVVERMSDAATGVLLPIADDPGLPAVEKLEGLFVALAQWKAARRDLVVELLRVWFSDGNTVVREQLRRGIAIRLTPLLERIVRQGTTEGVFTATSPEHAAGVLVSLIQGMNETASRLFLARQADAIAFEEVEQFVAASTEAFERILGLPAGSLTILDRPTMRLWFG